MNAGVLSLEYSTTSIRCRPIRILATGEAASCTSEAHCAFLSELLQNLVVFTGLQELKLHSVKMYDERFHLLMLTKLRSLVLENVRVDSVTNSPKYVLSENVPKAILRRLLLVKCSGIKLGNAHAYQGLQVLTLERSGEAMPHLNALGVLSGSLTLLDIAGTWLTNLKGLSALVKLRYLDISNNEFGSGDSIEADMDLVVSELAAHSHGRMSTVFVCQHNNVPLDRSALFKKLQRTFKSDVYIDNGYGSKSIDYYTTQRVPLHYQQDNQQHSDRDWLCVTPLYPLHCFEAWRQAELAMHAKLLKDA